MTPAQKELLQEFQEIARTASTAESLMQGMAKRLHEKMTRYNWVGFYLVDPADAGYLIVGPYSGSFSPNKRIPLERWGTVEEVAYAAAFLASDRAGAMTGTITNVTCGMVAR